MTGVGGSDRMGARGLLVAGALLLGLAGCDGDDGNDGTDGTDGAPGLACWDLNENGIKDFPEEDTNGDGVIDVLDCRSPGAGGGLSLGSPEVVELLVDEGEPIVAEIDNIETGSETVVDFTLTTAQGTPLTGLSADSISFTLVKLLPAADGEPVTWQSYLSDYEVARSGTPSPNLLERALQSGTDSGGELVDNGNGEYSYTFATDITDVTDPVVVPYEPSLTHRVGFEIRIDAAINPNNPTLDFVPDGGAGSGTKDIASTASCNSCHGRLEFHGGGRFTSPYCSTCHNPGTRDQDYAQLLDLAYMVHSIHAAALRSDAEEATGAPEGEFSYIAYGFSENFNGPPDDFSGVTYPQATNYCTTCHVGEGEDATPDGSAWNQTVTAQACGGCHVDGLVVSEPDENGLSTYEFNHPFGQFPNSTCLACHVSNGVAGETAELHLRGDPLERELGLQFVQTIVDVTGTSPGETPVVTYQYTDLEGNPYDVLDDPEFDAANGADLNLYIAWTTADYYNGDDLGNSTIGDGSNFRMRNDDFIANSSDNGDGTFTLTSTLTLPEDYTGDIGVFLNSQAAVEVEPGEYADAVMPVTAFYPGTAPTEVVENAKCNDCHEFLVFHGRRNDAQFCVTCHNADLAGDAGSVSLTYLGHTIHSAQPPFSDVTYPGRISNCLTCHEDGTYYGAPSDARAISTVPNDPAFWNDDQATSTTSYACATCHSSQTAQNHMSQNGGLFDAAKTQPQLGAETCSICHGEGGIADVAEVHNLQ